MGWRTHQRANDNHRRNYEKLLERRLECLRLQSRIEEENFAQFLLSVLSVLEVLRQREQLERRYEKPGLSPEIKICRQPKSTGH